MTLYRVVRAIVWAISKTVFRLSVEGAERLPASGPYVIAPTHRSNLDSFFVALVTKRRVRFMAKQEIWKVRWLGRLAEALGAFPVDRAGADRAALRTAMACVEAGEPLVVFPEGTRRRGPVVEDLHDGAAYVAARLGVPIVPIGIGGSEAILPKGAKVPRLKKVHLVVGDPLRAPDRDGGSVKRSDVRELTDGIEVALQKVFDEARTAVGE